MEIRRVTSSSLCLILVMRVEMSLLKSASGARKCISVLDGMGMELQSKPGGCMTHTIATEVAVLRFGGLQLILGPGVFTVFDLHEMDVPLFWRELTRVTDLGR
eukprot:442742-Pelagomonas_calceolata.AAC.1